MSDMITENYRQSAVDWMAARLPLRGQVAIAAVLALAWGSEFQAEVKRAEFGVSGASVQTTIVHNSGWDARLKDVQLTVLDVGNYQAQIVRDGKIVESCEFSVKDKPASITFNQVEPRGGVGGIVTTNGSPFNFGYGYSNHHYKLELTSSGEGGKSTSASVDL